MTTQQEHQLKRGLKNRHIQLIALGGAVGTGLFLGIAQTIRMAGPSVLLGYAIAGAIAFFIMRQLGEMVVEEPVAGSFSHFANRYWGPFAGFMSGWNYWVLYVLVSMAGDGALLVDENGEVHRIGCPKGKVVNSVGAGDSMVAGFVAGWMQTRSYSFALRLGTACGSATAFSLGLATKEKIDELMKEI